MTTGEKVVLGAVLVGGAVGAVAVLTRRKAHASTPVTRAAVPETATPIPSPPLVLVPQAPPASAPVPATPRPVAADDVEALARVIASESGRGIPDERLFIAWAVRNRAAARRVSIARLVCSPHCGPQSERINGKGVRPFSSRQSPRAVDRELARFVLSQPASADPTGGATSFIEPRLQDELHNAGRKDHRSYAEVRERWMRRGEVPIGMVGRFEFWRKGAAPTAAPTGAVA